MESLLNDWAIRPLKNPRIRLYHSIRTAHVERTRELAPASILYRVRSYDFDEKLSQQLDVVQAGTFRSALILLLSRPTSMEVNEPLMAEAAIHTAAVLALVRLITPAGSQPIIVSYAIENMDPFARRRATLKGRLKVRLQKRAAAYVWRNLDRLVFGTNGAEDLYRSSFPTTGHQQRQPTTTLVPALPAACACAKHTTTSQDVVFLGALSDRKGFPLVQAAWSTVKGRDPSATITVMGKGPLHKEAEEWSRTERSVTFLHDPARSTIHKVLRSAHVLVLPSQPSDTWREQVGLPIVEGLAHGCRIVTTSETGLAEWLTNQGHAVLDPRASAGVVGNAILAQRAAGQPDTAALPAVDGRLAADRWLFDE